MSDYVDLAALGKILLAGVLGGAGLVAVYALGLTGLARAQEPVTGGAGRSGRAGGLAFAALCFLVVAGGVALGIYAILAE